MRENIENILANLTAALGGLKQSQGAGDEYKLGLQQDNTRTGQLRGDYKESLNPSIHPLLLSLHDVSKYFLLSQWAMLEPATKSVLNRLVLL